LWKSFEISLDDVCSKVNLKLLELRCEGEGEGEELNKKRSLQEVSLGFIRSFALELVRM
jgi:hypothetical protein